LVLNGGEWSAACPSHITFRRKTPLSIEQEDGQTPQSIQMFWGGEKYLVLAIH